MVYIRTLACITSKMIRDTIKKYKELGDYFDPEYERDNEVLDEFKSKNQTLTKAQTEELKSILDESDILAKNFVADLLYLYDDFDESLLDPMVTTAIRYKDPSFNRIFIHPCIRRFGYQKVLAIIKAKFIEGDILDKIGVAGLLYWLRPDDSNEMTELINEIKKRSAQTDNLIELYHYKLSIKSIDKKGKIPNDAIALLAMIHGNSELEDLVFNQLGWSKK
jgi:hypothetical protein